jgi:hypothetical protein
MWKRRTKKPEGLPWYRQPSYIGKMSEAEKRILDSLRMKPAHPAATSNDLPEEVVSYINRIECDVYNLRREKLTNRTIVVSLVGAAWINICYFGLPPSTAWTYIIGAAVLVVPWFVCAYEWNKNAEEHAPSDHEPGALSATDEGIRREWELNYIVTHRQEWDLNYVVSNRRN